MLVLTPRCQRQSLPLRNILSSSGCNRVSGLEVPVGRKHVLKQTARMPNVTISSIIEMVFPARGTCNMLGMQPSQPWLMEPYFGWYNVSGHPASF